MKYDVFILFAREDAKFVRSLAKSFEKISLSVLYKESLASLNMASAGSLQKALKTGFQSALYGIVVISKQFFKAGFGVDDLDFLCEILLMEEQMLHPLWYNVNDIEVTNWYPRMAMSIALRSPPETGDSIARKFLVKIAGPSDLQRDVLNGFHPCIQYMPPKVGTYRPKEFEKSRTTVYEDNRRGFNDHEQPPQALPDESGATTSKPPNVAENEDNINDEPIYQHFTLELRNEISRRLDVYLKGLPNWKDLAAVFRIKDESQLRDMLLTKEPTMHLLDAIAKQGATVAQLKNALRNIDRQDVSDFIDQYLLTIG